MRLVLFARLFSIVTKHAFISVCATKPWYALLPISELQPLLDGHKRMFYPLIERYINHISELQVNYLDSIQIWINSFLYCIQTGVPSYRATNWAVLLEWQFVLLLWEQAGCLQRVSKSSTKINLRYHIMLSMNRLDQS